MAIQSIDTEGNLTWKCPHWPEHLDNPCGTANSAHISHEHIKWHGHPGGKAEHRTVSLPPCQGCGAQTFLKVAFTERELKAPNMWQPWNEWHDGKLAELFAQHEQAEEGTPHKAMLAQQIASYQTAKQAGGYHTDSHAMAMRHVELARQLVASGKLPPGQGEPGHA